MRDPDFWNGTLCRWVNGRRRIYLEGSSALQGYQFVTPTTNCPIGNKKREQEKKEELKEYVKQNEANQEQ